MQLTIVGAGAIGGTIGAHMARNGHDILLCDSDAEHVEAINRHGLRIEGPVDNFTVTVKAILPEDLPAHLHHVGVAVKSHHTVAAAALLKDRISPDGYVVSFQNGLTTAAIAAAVGRHRVLASFVNFGADVVGPGRILQGNVATFRVGEPDRAEVTPRVRELADALPYAQATDNIMGFLWGKEAYGAMLWAGAVSDLSIAASLEGPAWRPLMLAVAREVLAQAPARPEGFDGFDPGDLEGSLDRLVAFNRNSAKTHSGIYRDLMVRKRKTEVEGLLDELKGPLTTYTGHLVRAIERGERTCEVANLDLLAAYERAERLGRPLNAVVNMFPAPGRAPVGPLHGVAVAVKDLFDVKGSPRGCGNPAAMAGPPAAADAPLVASLRAAGADVFATSAMLEYAAGATNPDVPETLNPFDRGRTAGGSSGGSAALVAAGVCAVALGTDTGGSVRIPAHYCGTVGFKPSFGLLDLAGTQELAPSLDHAGLLAADVATTARVFWALTGGGDGAGRDEGTPAGTGREGPLRLGLARAHLGHAALAPGVGAALASAVARLGAEAELVEVSTAGLEEIDRCFDDIILYEAWQVHGTRAEANPGHYGPETLRLLLGASKVSRERYEEAMSQRRLLLEGAQATYAGIDALINPAAPFVAPATTPPVDTPEGEAEAMFTSVFNLTGAPAIVLPCGRGEHSLPVGLQLSSPPGTDGHLLAVAARVEQVLGYAPARLDLP